MNESTLTREKIEEAKKSKNHLVINAIDSLGKEYWANLQRELLSATQHVSELAKTGVILVADKIEGQPFELKSTDWISIWNHAGKVMSLYSLYGLSTALGLVYGTAPFVSGEWVGCYRKYHEDHHYLGSLSKKDPKNAAILLSRLNDACRGLNEIDFYVHGIHPDEDYMQIIKASIAGDKNAIERVQQIQNWKATHQDSLLENILENSGNGIYNLSAFLRSD